MTAFTANGHAPDSSRVPPWQIVEDWPERTPEQYRLHIASLMARPGVEAWQALMRQNALRAKKRRDVS